MKHSVCIVCGIGLALLALSFGTVGNLMLTLLLYGSAFFLLSRPLGVGLWYLGSAALTGDLLGTGRFGTYALIAALTYFLYVLFIGRLRFTSPANRRALALLCVVAGTTLILCHSSLRSVCLLAAVCLLILVSINYLLPERPSDVYYA